MSNFDFKRFRLLALYELKINMKTNLRLTLGMAVGLLFIYMIALWQMFQPQHGVNFEQYLAETSNTTAFAFMMFMIIGANMIFINMNTKQRHTAFCMLPASNAEKFAVRWLWSTGGLALMFAVAWVLADVVRLLFTLAILHTHGGSIVLSAMYRIGRTMESIDCDLSRKGMHEGIAMLAYVVSCVIMIHSAYILGGTLFRRYAALYTSMAIIAMGMTLISTDNFPYLFKGVLGYDTHGDMSTVTWCCTAVYAALTVMFYALAWRLFCRSQVTNNKLLNV